MRGVGCALRRIAVVGALAGLAWTGITPVSAVADESSPPVSEADQALAQAQESGQPVEVVGQRTENTTTYANPDGMTFTLDESAQPVRVRTTGGSWTAPDPTLQVGLDGTVSPKAAEVDLAFSGGGSDKPLVSIGYGGRSMALTWPGSLPTPVLDGDSVVYPDVFPDVDLRLTASVDGYREVLVVKTPAAAADSRVQHIAFGLQATGLHVRSVADGGLSAVGGDGREVFTSPLAQMWDSTGDAEAGQSSTDTSASTAAPGLAGPGVSADLNVAEEDSQEATDGPAPGAGVGSAVQTVDSDSLTVTPDADLLGSSDPASFPLYIDPDVSLSSGSPEHTLLRSDGYSDYGWANGTNGEGDGHCGTWDGYYCGPGYTQRLYFQFSPTQLKGKKVLKATFRVTSPWAFQCDPRWTDLERTNNFSSATSWSSRPKELDLMGDRNFSAGRGSTCDPDEPDAPIEFSDNPDEPDENLTPTVANFAAGQFSKLTLELRAHDETDTSAWKRFKNDGTLSVNYVAQPALPTHIGVVTSTGTVCETSSSDPAIIADPTPTLTATPQTAAGAESGAQLRVAFSVDKYTASTWSSAFADIASPPSGFVGDNVSQSTSAPTLSDGTLYRYRAWTRSYYDNQTDYIPGPSNASTTGWCYFEIDSTRPNPPTVTFTQTYTECLPNACVPGGGPNVAGSAQVAAASGDTDTAFEYKVSSSVWTVLASGVTTVPLNPQAPGTYHLEVRGKDSLGWGAETVKDFVVAAGAGPVGQWHFDEDSGPAVDSSSAVTAEQDNATLSTTGAVRDDFGRRGDLPVGDGTTTPDKGLHLDGTSGYAATADPVIDARASYTVGAWVRLDTSTVRTMGIVSQHGTSASPFFLSYAADGIDDWSFRVYSCPTPTTCTWQKARSTVEPVPGAWTYLAAEYDASQQQISLYVNGTLQSTVSSVAPAEVNGPLEFGRDSWSGSPVDYLDGSVDEVQVWQRALSSEEIANEARLLDDQGNGQTELVASWQPAGSSGTTVTDTVSGYGRTLTLSGTASLGEDGIVLDGSSGAATTAGPLVDETGSFTVSATVQLDSAVLAGKPDGYLAQVAGQRTADGSAWGLWYELVAHDGTTPLGLWHFGRLMSDGSFVGAVSTDPAELDTPVQLTGVFDALSTAGGATAPGTATLYLGAVQNDTDAMPAVAGAGLFAVGEGPSGSGWGQYLPGAVSDVRVWAGAMTSAQQVAATVGG